MMASIPSSNKSNWWSLLVLHVTTEQKNRFKINIANALFQVFFSILGQASNKVLLIYFWDTQSSLNGMVMNSVLYL